MTKRCDLHVHSNYSDGSLSPEQLLQQAQKIGLSAIALCDHNAVAGLPEFVAAAQEYTVEAVPGIEFSTQYQEKELHILGLFIRPAYYDGIGELMAQQMARKERSDKALVGALVELGMDISYEEIKRRAGGGYVNRVHIAAELTRKGYTATNKEAFQRYLDPERGLYVPPQRLDAFEAIRFIKSIGAVAVLAHPFLSLQADMLDRFLEQAAPCGLDAMETLYPTYDPATTALAQQMARQYGLLQSGGSDFHGQNKPDIQMGSGRGDLQVPSALLEQLRNRAACG